MEKLRLHGFNNLTKSLSFNIYDICYARTREQKQAYIAYLDHVFNADRLTQILTEVSDMIGAHILNIARQDYEPEGASVTILIAEEAAYDGPMTGVAAAPEAIVGHLDKSHITVHTYPEFHPDDGISTFRADIDVSTCGRISPLTALNHLIRSFESDVVSMDYRVRGFTRDVDGVKHFIDHDIHSIQDYISAEIRNRYQMIDVNVLSERIFHTKMRLTEFDLDEYLFAERAAELSAAEAARLTRQIEGEITEIFYGRNFPSG